MSNGNNEGHPGFVISQMEAVATPDLEDKPNVVLVYVGTNDMKFGNTEKAPGDMKKLVSFLTGKLPDSLIVVSTLFLNTNPTVQKRIAAFNPHVFGLEKLGNVVIADMSSALSASDISSDGTHPNDGGYAKMAKVFDAVLVKAERQGKISSPKKTTKLFKMCNAPVSISSQTGTHTSIISSSDSVSGKETPKPAKSQSTSTPTNIHSSNEVNALSELRPESNTASKSKTFMDSVAPKTKSSLASVTSKPKTSIDSIAPKTKGSPTSVASKPKSTTCDSKKGSTHSVISLSSQGGKTMAHLTTSSSGQSLPTKGTTPKKNLIASALKQSSSIEPSVSLHAAVSTVHNNLMSGSQASLPSIVLTSDSTGNSVLPSVGSETASIGYSTGTPGSDLVSAASISASNQASTSPPSSQGNDAADSPSAISTSDDLEGKTSSNSPAVSYSSAGNTSNSSHTVLSSTGSDRTAVSLIGLMTFALGLLVIL